MLKKIVLVATLAAASVASLSVAARRTVSKDSTVTMKWPPGGGGGGCPNGQPYCSY